MVLSVPARSRVFLARGAADMDGYVFQQGSRAPGAHPSAVINMQPTAGGPAWPNQGGPAWPNPNGLVWPDCSGLHTPVPDMSLLCGRCGETVATAGL